MVPAAAGFSGEVALNGDLGRVRELWNLGDRTVDVDGCRTLREVVRVAFVFACAAVVWVLARFFGFARSP